MTLFVVAYLGGVLTILSPCILPVLPFVFARAGQPFLKSTLPMLVGMGITFALVATLAALGGSWAVSANQYGRTAALVLLALFGLSLLFPSISQRLAQPAVFLGNKMMSASVGKGAAPTVLGSISLGIATGLLWAPCAGPILGLVLTAAALKGANIETSALLLAYAAGSATSLALGSLIGGRVFKALKSSLGASERIRQGLGIAVIAAVIAIFTGLDTGLLASASYASTGAVEQALIDKFNVGHRDGKGTEVASNGSLSTGKAFKSALPVEGMAPSLDGAVTWLNSPPLTAAELRGKVVLVDFWTYSCINCIRTIPYVRAWAEKYKDQGLVVVGVHSPEFAFEKDIGNVKTAIGDFKIQFPVAIDNNYKIWRAFDNNYWPAHYLIDANGQIRYHHFGEGNYSTTEDAIEDLLHEAGDQQARSNPVVPDARGSELGADFGDLRSEETYVGFKQAANFVSPGGIQAGKAAQYSVTDPGLNEWGLDGNWTVEAEKATLNAADGKISYHFSARDLHLVMGTDSSNKPIRFQVSIDGHRPGDDHGSDTDADGFGIVTSTKLYQLVRQHAVEGERTFTIKFLDSGVDAYAFTFG